MLSIPILLAIALVALVAAAFVVTGRTKVKYSAAYSDDIVDLIETRRALDREINSRMGKMNKLTKWLLEKKLAKRGLIT